MMGRRGILLALAGGLLAALAPAQSLDNTSLTGSYFVRYVALTGTQDNGAYSLLGTINFDGRGNYQYQGIRNDSRGSRTVTATGGYTVSANGVLAIDNPIDSTLTLYGALGDGAIAASSTEDLAYDTFIAIPVSGSNANNGRLNGTYRTVSLDYLQGRPVQARNAFFTLNANGQGSLGDVSVSGSILNQGNNNISQTVSGATYAVNPDGSAAVTFPLGSAQANTRLVGGQKTVYVSGDGNLFIGGAPDGYDIVVGVKAASGASNTSLQGFYYTAGLQTDASQDAATGGFIQAYSGAFNSNGQGLALWNLRYNPDGDDPYDYTYDFSFTINSDGSISTSYFRYYLSVDGRYFIGSGFGNNYELAFAVRARQFSGSGVFLSPVGAVNAASFSPATYPISPGEFLNLFGTGLSAQTQVASSLPLPTNLAGIEVLVNGVNAPVYSVSPTQVSIIVPYSLDVTKPANIQVRNNGTLSNTVSVYTADTSPGVFTLGQSGVGPGVVLHADFRVVNASSPARRGETVLIYLTGLGRVSPEIPAGSAAPVSGPLSTMVNQIGVFIDGIRANVQFAGLAPGFAGLYQLNVTIPNDASTGDVYLDISTFDAYHSQATINIAP